MTEEHSCRTSTGIHEDMRADGTSQHPWGLTFGSGKLDDYGYWEFACSDCARKAEIKDKVAKGSYWPFT